MVLWDLGRPAPEADELAGKDVAAVPPSSPVAAAAGAPTAARQQALCLLRVVGLGLFLTHRPRQEPGEQVREPQADSSGPCADVGTEASTTGAPPCRVPIPRSRDTSAPGGVCRGVAGSPRVRNTPFAFQTLLKTFLNLLPGPGRKQKTGLTFQVSGTFQSSGLIAQGQKHMLTIS